MYSFCIIVIKKACNAHVCIQADEEDVTLRGGEKMRIRLKLKGLQSGLLKVTGIRWQLEGAAFGQKALQLRQLPQPRSRYSLAEQHAIYSFTPSICTSRSTASTIGLLSQDRVCLNCLENFRYTFASPALLRKGSRTFRFVA